jgi:hypothetical protein
MYRLMMCALLLAATPSLAGAATRSYSLPTDQGKAISDCLADGQSCGKAAADQFCRMAGFSESILFAREHVASAAALDGNRRCNGEACEAFTRIKCYTPDDAEQASAG